jgi:uncharacterized protein (DUF433 family)
LVVSAGDAQNQRVLGNSVSKLGPFDTKLLSHFRVLRCTLGDMTVETLAHISVDPLVCHGQACVTGTRIPVSVVLDCLADGMAIDEIIGQYPSLTSADVRAAAAYGAALAREEVLHLAGDPGIIVLRPEDQRVPSVVAMVESLLDHHDLANLAGCNAVIQRNVVRVRRRDS